MDDIAKRKFDRIAGLIARDQIELEAHIRGINSAAIGVERLLVQYLDLFEGSHGPSDEILDIRRTLEATFDIFKDIRIFPALDSAQHSFDEIVIRIARLAGSLSAEK